MWAELRVLFATWIATVAAAADWVARWIVPQQQILLLQGDRDIFTARLTKARKDLGLPERTFRLVHGMAEPAFDGAWQAAMRGSHIDVLLRPDDVLFRAVDFPKAAADFLDGMVRAQIDRLTPWTANDAVFGLSRPQPIAGERIALVVAATSQGKIQPLVKLAANLGAASVAGLVERDDAGRAIGTIAIFRQSLRSAVGAAVDVPQLLHRTLLATFLAAAASLAVAAYVGSLLELDQQELSRQISQRRAALRVNQGGESVATLLAKRKQTSPSSVMVIEAISRALPDSTYVTEFRIDADKVQVVGQTQDAPSLIKLMEQSPQFTRATFFAPTTRGQNESGERFHIEAHITPYFGAP